MGYRFSTSVSGDAENFGLRDVVTSIGASRLS